MKLVIIRLFSMLGDFFERVVLSKSRFRNSQWLTESGAVLAEFTVTLPLLIIFFIGTFEVGRRLAQVNWLRQITFATAYVGSTGVNAGSIEEQIKNRAKKLLVASQNKEIEGGAELSSDAYSFEVYSLPSASGTTVNQWVRVEFRGELRSILPAVFGRNISVSTTLPNLLVSGESVAAEFRNPQPLYNQDGQAVS